MFDFEASFRHDQLRKSLLLVIDPTCGQAELNCFSDHFQDIPQKLISLNRFPFMGLPTTHTQTEKITIFADFTQTSKKKVDPFLSTTLEMMTGFIAEKAKWPHAEL